MAIAKIVLLVIMGLLIGITFPPMMFHDFWLKRQGLLGAAILLLLLTVSVLIFCFRS